jgi:hypothetical protein
MPISGSPQVSGEKINIRELRPWFFAGTGM